MRIGYAVAVLALLSGCVTQSQALAGSQPTATQVALARGRFDLGCPGATATVLSSDYVEPAIQGRWGDVGITRLEYTVGVEGCGQRRTYVVVCQEGSTTCFAADSQGR
jgi:hypothetical protein